MKFLTTMILATVFSAHVFAGQSYIYDCEMLSDLPSDAPVQYSEFQIIKESKSQTRVYLGGVDGKSYVFPIALKDKFTWNTFYYVETWKGFEFPQASISDVVVNPTNGMPVGGSYNVSKSDLRLQLTVNNRKLSFARKYFEGDITLKSISNNQYWQRSYTCQQRF